MGSILDNIELFKLKKINNPKGDIWHGLKKSEPSFIEFGEAYFSFIKKILGNDQIKCVNGFMKTAMADIQLPKMWYFTVTHLNRLLS